MKISNASMKPEICRKVQKAEDSSSGLCRMFRQRNITWCLSMLFPQKLNNNVLARKQIASVECSMLSCILYRNCVVTWGTSQKPKNFEETRQLKAYVITNSNNKAILLLTLKKVWSLPHHFVLHNSSSSLPHTFYVDFLLSAI